jgi:transposase InsO family protein
MVVATELRPVPVRSPWYHVRIDFVGPICPTSKCGNKYILTLSDYFTKWVEAIPLPTKCAPGVAKSLFKIFMRMGLPKILTSDQGGEFRSQLEKEIMDMLKIRRHYITPYHPQANGLDERWNQTLKQMLIKFTEGRKDEWDQYLDTCVFAYNTAKHESTLHSPFEIMFGRKAILPVDLDFEKQNGDQLLNEYHTSHENVSDIYDL